MSQRRALCIGIDAYPGRNRLGGCVNDTKKWSKFFTDRKFLVTVLTDQQATFDGIVTAIKKLIDSAVSGDIVAIHYSGHGTRVPDTSKQEVDGQDEALVPIDFGTKGFIVDDLIGPLIDRAKPGVAVHAFFDCCHSGGGTRLLATSDAAGSEDEKVRFLVLTPKMIEVHNREQQKRVASNQRGVGEAVRGAADVLAVDGTMREVLFAACQPSEQAVESGGNGQFARRDGRSRSSRNRADERSVPEGGHHRNGSRSTTDASVVLFTGDQHRAVPDIRESCRCWKHGQTARRSAGIHECFHRARS